MDPFQISEALAKVLAAAGVTKERTQDIARDAAAKYPDLAAAEKYFEATLQNELSPSLNAATILGLLRGAWDELKTGHPGYNPHHFGGA